MKIVSWNVNSLRMRLERVIGFLQREQPDVLCLQETKLQDEDFPADSFTPLGYASACFGQRGGYNGVAVLSRHPIGGLTRGFDGDPLPGEARVLSVEVGGLTLVNIYVVNGQSVTSDKYPLKLAWLDAFSRWVETRCDRSEPLMVLGDFNIAPADIDVYEPSLWTGRVLCTAAERRRLQHLMELGLSDLLRLKSSERGIYTWWDYRFGAFQRDLGLRIDLALGSAQVAERCLSVRVDRDERKPRSGPGKPSDHAPLIAELAA